MREVGEEVSGHMLEPLQRGRRYEACSTTFTKSMTMRL